MWTSLLCSVLFLVLTRTARCWTDRWYRQKSTIQTLEILCQLYLPSSSWTKTKGVQDSCSLMNVSGVPRHLKWHWCMNTWVLSHDLQADNLKTIRRMLSWRNIIFRLWFLSPAGLCFHLHHWFLARREKIAPLVSPLWAEFLVQTWEALAQPFPNHTHSWNCAQGLPFCTQENTETS